MSSLHVPLAQLLSRPDVWRGGLRAPLSTPVMPTGLAALNDALPAGGWPLGALTEIYAATPGIGEVGLLLPTLAELTRRGRFVAIIAPPFALHAPALAAAGVVLSHCLVVDPPDGKTRAWTCEQLLRSGAIAATLAWIDEDDDRSLRRLQLAAETGHALAVLYRPPRLADRPSPAALRVWLDQSGELEVFKCRGTSIAPQRPQRMALRGEVSTMKVVPFAAPSQRH